MIAVNLPTRDAEWLIEHLERIVSDRHADPATVIRADAVLAALGVWHRPPPASIAARNQLRIPVAA